MKSMRKLFVVVMTVIMIGVIPSVGVEAASYKPSRSVDDGELNSQELLTSGKYTIRVKSGKLQVKKGRENIKFFLRK